MKNRFIKCLVLVMCVFVLVIAEPVCAWAGIVINEKTIAAVIGDGAITEVKVYKLAYQKPDGSHELTDAFKQGGYTVESLIEGDSGYRNQAAEELAAYATQSGMECNITTQNLSEECKIEVDSSGVYLVLIGEIIFDDILCEFQPVICMMNTIDDVSVSPKYTLTDGYWSRRFPSASPGPTPETPGSGITLERFPQTGLQLIPVYILAGAGIVCLITAWGLKRKQMKYKLPGRILCVAGTCMILSIAGIYLNHYMEEKNALSAMNDITASIKENQNLADSNGQEAQQEYESADSVNSSVFELDGSKYIGILEIPSLSLELPIADDCSKKTLKTSPGCFLGQPGGENFVIGAHNFKTQFGYIDMLQEGSELVFTDINGVEYNYEVAKVTTVGPTQTDVVQNEEYDFAMFTCTYGGANRIVVLCKSV